MKIVYIENVRLPTEKAHGIQIMKTCEALARAGNRLELVVPERANNIKEEPFAYYGIEQAFALRTIPVPNTLFWGTLGYVFQHVVFSLRAARHARQSGADLFYSRDPLALALLGAARSHAIWETHDGDPGLLKQFLARRIPKVVAVTAGRRSFWMRKGFAAERIAVIPNGVDLAAFAHPESREQARARLKVPGDEKIALYVGKTDGWKGVDTLCSASRELPDTILVCIIGGEAAKVERLSKEFPRVRFLGFHPYRELADNLQAADVLILPNTATEVDSASYTSPIKLFAYMTSGIPIIASDIASIREIVDSSSAALVQPDNPKALAQAIQKTLLDTAGSEVRALRAKELVRQYSWQERAKKIIHFATAPL